MERSDVSDRIDAIAQRAMEEAEARGMAVGISLPTGERILRGYGFANHDAGIPATRETLFEIGSISKSFLGIVFMQLASEGKLDLHAPVTEYVPWFSVRSDHAPITAHHLLCHTAGLPTGFAHRPDSLYELWELRNVRAAAPEAFWHYSDVGYSLLGVLAETILGQPFDRLLTERVLQPLGFTNATASVTSGQRPTLAVGYKRQFDGRPWRSGDAVYPATWLETSSGAGSIVMDVSDMLGYAEFLLRTWQGTDSPALTSAQLRAMVDPSLLPPPAVEEGYGYGLYWGTDEDSATPNETIYLDHGGDMVGYESAMIVDIANGICVVMLANGSVPDYMMTNDVRKVGLAAMNSEPLPELTNESLRAWEGAEAWTGNWRSRQRTVLIALAEDGLTLIDGAERIPLQRFSRRTNSYLAVDSPDWDRFLLEAERDEDEDDDAPRPIVRLTHGGETFVRDDAPLPEAHDYPDAWDGYVGFYRSYNPWYPALRVVLRDGRLVLVNSYGTGTELVPEADGFRVGAEPPNFDWLMFEPILDGQAQGIRFETGAIYTRFFTT